MELSPDTEITLNLWYIYDDQGVIYRLLVRPYVDSGSEEAKRKRLRELANTDFWIAQQSAVPERFHTRFIMEDGEKTQPVCLMAANDQMPPLAIFEDAIRAVEAQLPGFCPLRIPQAPVVCITPLMMDDAGNLYPKFARTAPLKPERGQP